MKNAKFACLVVLHFLLVFPVFAFLERSLRCAALTHTHNHTRKREDCISFTKYGVIINVNLHFKNVV
jgi:hypothetical protein